MPRAKYNLETNNYFCSNCGRNLSHGQRYCCCERLDEEVVWDDYPIEHKCVKEVYSSWVSEFTITNKKLVKIELNRDEFNKKNLTEYIKILKWIEKELED